MPGRYLIVVLAWILDLFLVVGLALATPQIDKTFGLNGRVAVELGAKNSGHAVLVQPDGKIVVAGSSSKGSALNFSLLRFNKNGSLDNSFNGDGSVITSLSIGDDEALALGLLSDGRIIAAGYSHNGRDRDLAIVCYRKDGSLDKEFGDKGVVLTSIGNGNEEITAVVISPSNRITVVGSTEGTAGRVLVTARYFDNGEPDDAFGEQGISLIAVGADASAEGILEREDGTLVLSGSFEEQKKSSAILVGLRADGAVDTSFGDKGVAVPAGNFAASEGYGLAVDSDGRVYVAGSVGLPGARDAALFRFTRNGKSDPAFGEQGAVVTGISKEDDVLYDVHSGKNGVVASGFTTDAGTRQFLLNSYSLDGAEAEATAGDPTMSARSEDDDAERVPVQEVRVNGKTRVQIRRLQIWNNEVQIRDLEMSSSSFDKTTVRQSPETLSPGMSFFKHDFSPEKIGPSIGWLSVKIAQQISEFFLPAARAEDGSGPEKRGPSGGAARSITTTFSEGESVSYAVTVDGEGNIIVVGTADGNDGSSIVAARFVAEDLIDRITDQPGHRNRHIATVVPVDVTRTTIATGGEIADSFGKEVVRRGVVFSVTPGPVSLGKSFSGAQGSSAVQRGGIGTLASSFLLPEVVAADTAPSQPNAVGKGGSGSPESSMVEGETVSGAGTGGFVTILNHLLPSTVYYIRAYAFTDDGGVYYGNQISVRTADACFIATASFGTFLHPCVGILRDFRDAYLVNSDVGKWMVDGYYSFSPPWADVIAGNSVLRFVVRVLLLPFVGFSWLALQAGMGGVFFFVIGAMALLGWLVVRCRLWMNMLE